MPVKIRQQDVTDCGAACIASVAAHYQLEVPVSKIRQLASTDKKGTNVLGLLEAFEKLGFHAKGVRGSIDSLLRIPKPAIAHLVVNKTLHHYVVVYEVTKSHIEIMDPTDGLFHRLELDEFQNLWTGVLVITMPGENFQKGSQRTSLFSRLWSLTSPHKTVMLEALTGALVYTVIGLSTSIYIQKIVDYVLIDGNRNLLNLLSVGMIALLAIQVLMGSMKSILIIHTARAIDAQLILGYYKHLLRLPQQFFDTMRVGEIMSRITDAIKIRSFINETLTAMAANVFIVVLSFSLMFTYYWKLALVVSMVIPFYAVIYLITNFLNQKVERKLMERSAELESQLVESLHAVATIKSLGLEKHSSIKTETRFITLLQSVHTSGLNSIFTGSSAEFISRLFTIILLWAGAGFALSNEITPGELLSFYALTGYFTGPVSSLIASNKLSQNALIAADRLFEIMDLEIERPCNGVELGNEPVGSIRFTHVSFRYGSRVTVFEDLNLEIPAGKVTAIAGESGSGKSTLVRLLQNLYPLQTGQIHFGEYNLQNIQQTLLRRWVSVVPQRIDLFAGNVIDNIAIGEYSPDVNKVIRICSDLGIAEFIDKLPHGLNTYLGENGVTLSGGQKQRIAIARALYRGPEILILDEATSSLDSHSEKYVRKMVDMLREQKKTVIIIAHRLSTIFEADKIVVLKNGHVAEEGRHEELLKNKKAYYDLWVQQFPMMNKFNSIDA